MVERTETDSIFQLVCSALVLNWNYVSGIDEIKLNAADSAPEGVSCQHVFTKPGIADLAVNSLQHSLSGPGGNVCDLASNAGVSDSHELVEIGWSLGLLHRSPSL